MTVLNNPVSKQKPIFDKFDQMTEVLERASALAEVGCSIKFGELNEITIFRYFATLFEILSTAKKLSSELKAGIKVTPEDKAD